MSGPASLPVPRDVPWLYSGVSKPRRKGLPGAEEASSGRLTRNRGFSTLMIWRQESTKGLIERTRTDNGGA